MCVELRCAGAGFSVLAHRFFLGAWRDVRGCESAGAVDLPGMGRGCGSGEDVVVVVADGILPSRDL